MKIKRRMGLAALLLALLFAVSAAAEVSGINILGSAPVIGAPAVYLEVRALDSTGMGLRTQQQDYRFTVGDSIELSTGAVAQGSRGHIVVVDTSLYYYGSSNIGAEDIREIVSAYLSRLSSDEQVMFVLASDGARPTSTSYMSMEHARQYAQGIELGKEKSARINTAIYEAFRLAISPAQGAPIFNSVFIVADPDLENNQDREHSLSECVQLRAASGRNFDVATAVVHRENFLKDTNDTRRKALNEGFAAYEEFSRQCGGRYIRIPQDNKGVDTSEVHVQLASWLYTTHSFCVDFSALSGHIALEPQVQNVKLSISCNGAVREVNVQLDTALLPEPESTPVPTPDMPTPTPAPTPVVGMNQGDATAMQAINALHQLRYLSRTNVDGFDNECYIAYINFCKNNGLEPRDGIYQEGYDLLLSGKAVAVELPTPTPTATPAPTPTPVPTIPPDGYRINDQDTENSGGYIALIQTILKELNCYQEDAAANVGRMDQATIDAANKYCEAFNWRNDHPDGVSKEICSEIITNGGRRKPVATPEPTLRDKAKAFLAGSTQIMQFTVPNWGLVAACFGLVILILLILILAGSGKKGPAPEKPKPPIKPEQPPKKPESPITPANSYDGYEPKGSGWAGVGNVEGATVDPHISTVIYLDIRYANNLRREKYILKEDLPVTIGRRDSKGIIADPELILDAADKSASRGQHAVLRFKNGQVYLSDRGKYHNTQLNGMGVFEREGREGVPVESGDEIRVSGHVIAIKW